MNISGCCFMHPLGGSVKLQNAAVPTCRATLSRKSAEIMGHYCVFTWGCPSWRKCGSIKMLYYLHTGLSCPWKVWRWWGTAACPGEEAPPKESAEPTELRYPHTGLLHAEGVMCFCAHVQGCLAGEGTELTKYDYALTQGCPTQRKGGLETQTCRAAPPSPCSDNR